MFDIVSGPVPELVTVTTPGVHVWLMCVPGKPNSVVERVSALVLALATVVLVVAVLLARFGSDASEVTLAESVSVPMAVVVTTIFTVADVVAANVPKLQVIVAVPEQDPAEG